MSANHTIPPIAYGAIYEGETMGTTERVDRAMERLETAHRNGTPILLDESELGALRAALAARLEGEEEEVVGYVSEQNIRALEYRREDDDYGFAQIWSKPDDRNSVALVRRQQGGE